MGSLLVHITHGKDAPTRAALGFLVARTAKAAGHDVTLALVGDGVELLDQEIVAQVEGVGTGALAEHVPAVVEAGIPIFCSAMSSKARGYTEEDFAHAGATFILPDKLVELVFAHDRVLTY